MIIRESPPPAVRHVAMVGVKGALLSSIGTLVDGMSLVAAQVQQMHEARYRKPMHTRLRLLSADGRPVRPADGRELAVDGRLDEREQFRIAHVPAFQPDPSETLEERLVREAPVIAWLRRQRAAQALVSASGCGVFLVAEAGLLNDGVASVPRAYAAEFRRRYPRVRIETRAALAEHDGVLTAGALGAEWQLTARLVELAFSPQVAGWLASVTGLMHGPADPAFLADDPLVAGAQFWLSERFAGTFKLPELAGDLAVSHSTLIRRFKRSLGMTPRDYVQMLRVESARGMLLQTERSVYEIALMVGYADARALRTVFREHTGKSPTEYRLEGARTEG